MNTPEKMAALFGEARLEIVHAWSSASTHHTWSLDQFVMMRTTFAPKAQV